MTITANTIFLLICKLGRVDGGCRVSAVSTNQLDVS